jgi:hypothetical protein
VSCIGSKGLIAAFIVTFGVKVTCFAEVVAGAASAKAVEVDLPVDAIKADSIATDEPRKLSCSF